MLGDAIRMRGKQCLGRLAGVIAGAIVDQKQVLRGLRQIICKNAWELSEVNRPSLP
jgi:hypothetical protein